MPRFKLTATPGTPTAPTPLTAAAVSAAYEDGRRAGQYEGLRRGRALGEQMVEAAVRARLRAAIAEGVATHEQVNAILLGRRSPAPSAVPSAPAQHHEPPVAVVAAAPEPSPPPANLGAFTDGHLCHYLHPLGGLTGRVTWTDGGRGHCHNCGGEVSR